MRLKLLLSIILCSLFLFYKYVTQLYPSLISVDLIHNYFLSGVQVSILASSYYYSYSTMQIFAGFIIDKFDVKIPVFLSIITIALSVFIFSHTKNYFMMCLLRVFMGMGCAFATVIYVKCSACWASPKIFVIITSFLATAAMIGATLGSTPVANLFEHVGWHHGLEYISFIGLMLAFVCLYFLSNKSSPYNTNGKTKITKADFLVTILNKNNWVLMIYAGATFAPVIILGGLWGTPFLMKKYAIEVVQSSYLLSTMFIGLGLGAPFWAFISTKLNFKKELMHANNAVSFVMLFFIVYLNFSYYLTLTCFFTLGFTVSIFMLSFDLCRIFNSVHVIGIAAAFMNSGEGLVTSIIEPFIGKILDIRKGIHPDYSVLDFQIAFLLIFFCFIISSVAISFLKIIENSEEIKLDLETSIHSGLNKSLGI